MSLFFFIFITFLQLLSKNLINTEIVFVFEQFRNGIYEYSSIGETVNTSKVLLDILDRKLSPAGMRSIYLLGIYIREKYKNIINRKITSKNVFLYSKELDLHVLCAQSQLLGMFPLEEGILLNKIEIDLSFPQTKIPLEAEVEIGELGNLSVPKTIKPFALRYFSDEVNKHLLSITNECEPLNKLRVKNSQNEEIQNIIKEFNKKHKHMLLGLFNMNEDSSPLLDDFHYLLRFVQHYIIYYRVYLSDFKIDESQQNFLEVYNDCVKFINKSLELVEATEDVSIISMSSTLKKLIKFMDQRIKYDKEYDEESEELNEDNTPKFVIYSGDILSVYYLQVVLRKGFNVPLIYPDFAANQFLELHRQDGIPYKKLNATHYHVEYYFNGELLLNVSYVKFKEIIGKLEWNSKKINNFCKEKSPSKIDHIFYASLFLSIFIISLSILRTKWAAERLKNLTEKPF